jgi:hypothetical protein
MWLPYLLLLLLLLLLLQGFTWNAGHFTQVRLLTAAAGATCMRHGRLTSSSSSSSGGSSRFAADSSCKRKAHATWLAHQQQRWQQQDLQY